MATCPSCQAEIDPDSIRCVVCGRIITRNRQEMLKTRARMMQANANEQQALNREQKAALNSWMYARAAATDKKYGIADRVTDLLLNSMVVSMSSLAVFLTLLYFAVYYFPEQSYKTMIALKLIEPPRPVVIQ